MSNLAIYLEYRNKNSWIHSSTNIALEGNLLKADLDNGGGRLIPNEIEIHPVLEDKNLANSFGFFRYCLTEDEDNQVMKELFPVYDGETIPVIEIQQAIMLSVFIPTYNNMRKETVSHLSNYKLPPLSVHFGYTPSNASKSPFFQYMYNPKQRNHYTVGMLEIFQKFVDENETKGNNWLLYFEDDVRVVNVDPQEDLTKLYKVPVDAELIRPYIGKKENVDLHNVDYHISYGGGNNHAFYISRDGCQKVLNYAKKYKWRHICDIDIYKLAKHCGNFPTGYDGWSLSATGGKNDITDQLEEDEKINMYHLSHIIFNQKRWL